MLRKSAFSVAQQVEQACQKLVIDGARDGLPSLACSLPACSTAYALLISRCSSSASSSGQSGAPASRLDGKGPAAVSSSAAAAAQASSSETPVSFLVRQQRALAAIPPVPKMLGFAGAIPFLTLTPAFLEAAGMPDFVQYCAQMQLMYGGSVVTFLGAVHWGLAMNRATLAAAGTRAATEVKEVFMWSVVPSMAVVPALMMQPAQGSFAISVLLGICYLSDASYHRSGHLPAWYLTLRGYLTLLALTGMLATTTHYFKKDLEKARKMMEEEDAKRAARLEARAAAAAAGAGPGGVAAAGVGRK